MNFVVACPQCDAKHKVDLAVHGGKRVKCKKCQQEFSLPPKPPGVAAPPVATAPGGVVALPVAMPPVAAIPPPEAELNKAHLLPEEYRETSASKPPIRSSPAPTNPEHPQQVPLPRGAGNPLMAIWDMMTRYKCPTCGKYGGDMTDIELLSAHETTEMQWQEGRRVYQDGRLVWSEQYRVPVDVTYFSYVQNYECCYCGDRWSTLEYDKNPGSGGKRAVVGSGIALLGIAGLIFAPFITIPAAIIGGLALLMRKFGNKSKPQ
jgi:predicted Zn finger-like uncharacterized protein